MMRRSHILAVVLMTLLGLAFALGQSIHKEKLHPAFQALLTNDQTSLLRDRGGSASLMGMSKEGKPVYDAIITTADADAVRATGIHVNSVYKNFVTAQVSREDLLKLVQLKEVNHLDPGSINYPQLDISMPETGANLLHAGFLNKTPYKGKGVIVVIYDTGIDWTHLDFRDPADTTKSRILSIWDQTITPNADENSPSGFSYGVEYTKEQIENEIDGTPTGFVREKDVNGHGSHVAGIATGNGNSYFRKYVGMAPEADIIVVKGGDNSFGETKMIDGLTYAGNKAKGKPVVLNWSIGGQSGPHNGNRPYELAVNSFVSSPGKVVVISAGNEGDKNIHLSGAIAPGGTTSITINVPTYTPTAGTDNDNFQLDVWFNSPVGVTAKATSPTNVSLEISPNSSGTAGSDADGTIELYNSPSPLTDNSTLVQLFVHDKSANVPKTGPWTLTFSNATASNSFDAWLSSFTVGSQSVSITGGNSQKTVGMPGTAEGAITVASYITKNGWPSFDGKNWIYSGTVTVGTRSSFSSIGPTGDGRQKPDIAAPGQGISSSLSVAVGTADTAYIQPGMKDQLMQGTSQAAPHVTGAAAVLLQVSPGLTAVQVKGLLTSAAASDASTGSVPNMQYGYGKLDILKAAAKAFNPLSSVQRLTFAYDVDGTNQTYTMTGSTKYAVRFSPTITGQITGMQANITTAANRPIQGTGPLVCEVWSNTTGSLGGVPGTKMGNTVLYPFERLSTGTNNYIDMTAAGVTVTAEQDYHLVISLSNPKDTIILRADSPPAVATNRSSIYNGSLWKNLLELSSSNASNLRLRAIVTSASGLVFVENTGSVPQEFQLAQNFPNPFNPSTSIRYSVPVQSRIRLRVFDLIGREVASLVDEQQAPGNYAVNWHGTDNAGVPLSTGVYFYRLESAGQQLTKKMILLK